MSVRCILMAACLVGLLVSLTDAPADCQTHKPELVVQVGHKDVVNFASFSPDGKTVVTASEDGTAKLWDVQTGALLRTLPYDTGPDSFIHIIKPDERGALFSPDGRIVVTAGGRSDESAKLWDAATGALLYTLKGHAGDDLRCAWFSPDGKTLVTTGWDTTAELWDVGTGALLHTLEEHSNYTDYIQSASFSPDGKALVTAGCGDTANLWDVQTGVLLSTLAVRSAAVLSASFSPDGGTIATTSRDGIAEFWDAATGALLRTLNLPSYNASVSFSPDGRTLVTAGPPDKTASLWDTRNGVLVGTLVGHTDSIWRASFSPNSRMVLTTSMDGTARLWDARTGGSLHMFKGHTGQIVSASFSPDSRMVVAASTDGTARVWDVGTGALLRTLTGRTNTVISASFSPDGHSVAANSSTVHFWDEKPLWWASPPTVTTSDSTVHFWDVETGALLRSLPPRDDYLHPSPLRPDQRMSVTTNKDSIDLRSVATGALIRRITSGDGDLYSGSLSPDGRMIAAVGHDGLKVWDVETGALLHTLKEHMAYVTSASFSPDSRKILTASDTTVALWDVRTGSLLRAFKGNGVLKMPSVSFSPDGRRIAVSASFSNTSYLWDVASGALLHRLTGCIKQDDSSPFSPDSRIGATSCNDGSIRFWRADTGADLCSAYAFDNDDWVVVTPDGRFDSNNLDNIQNIHWVLPDQPFTPIPIEAFFAQYYTPGLLAHLLHNDSLPPLPDISTLNRVQPNVTVDSIIPHPGNDPALVDVTVSYTSQQDDLFNKDGAKKTETSGVYDLRLFRNGQLVASLPEDSAPGAAPEDLSRGKADQTMTHTFSGIRLARDGAKSVMFTAYAFNQDKVKSLTASLDYIPQTPLPAVKGRAWVITFGVDAYQDPHWNLRYAVADARAFRTQLVPRLRNTGQYAQVTFVPLVSPTGKPVPDILPATKAALRATLLDLAGKTPDAQSAMFTATLQKLGVTKAAPEDMIFIAFSCHGDADPETGEYYLFPSDIGPDQSNGLTRDLEAHSISSAELTRWMQDVDAGEMTMVIDSCHSAAAAGRAFKPGPMDSAGLGQLAYYKRMRILSASASDAVAKEYPDLGHGLLTAALVGDGLVNGKAQPAPGQSVLTVGQWLTFAKDDVPELDAHEQRLELTSNRAVMVNGRRKAPDDGLQKPSLFDFHRADAPDAVIAAKLENGKAP